MDGIAVVIFSVNDQPAVDAEYNEQRDSNC